MPIYEYICGKCGERFEKLQKADSGEELSCPACGASKVEKQLSSFAPAAASSSSCKSGG